MVKRTNIVNGDNDNEEYDDHNGKYDEDGVDIGGGGGNHQDDNNNKMQ